MRLEANIPEKKGSHSRATITLSGVSSASVSVNAVGPSNKKINQKMKQPRPSTMLLKGPGHMTQ